MKTRILPLRRQKRLHCYFLQVSLCLNRDFKYVHVSVQELPCVFTADVATSVTLQRLRSTQAFKQREPHYGVRQLAAPAGVWKGKRSPNNEETKR